VQGQGSQGQLPGRRHSIPEALNRWRLAIKRCLNIEWIANNGKHFGKIVADRKIVLEKYGRRSSNMEPTETSRLSKAGF
jgi:hypothetical protein